MKISHECGACFLRQAGEALDLATDDSELKINIFNDIFNFLSSNFDKNTNSNKTGSTIHNMIKQKTGCKDPYKQEKILSNKIALKYLPKVEKALEADDSLENHVKIAIIGNILDFGAFTLDTNVDELIDSALKKQLKINHAEDLEKSARNNNKLLYLVDNTGEIVFDKLLLKKLKSYDLDITIAVKSKPILNDACMEDAIEVGLDKYGKIVEIGAGTVGYVDSEISDEFREIFNSHNFIISKGMGNYEGLTEIDNSNKELYFLLCSKCSAISKDIGVNLQDMVLLKNSN